MKREKRKTRKERHCANKRVKEERANVNERKRERERKKCVKCRCVIGDI